MVFNILMKKNNADNKEINIQKKTKKQKQSSLTKKRDFVDVLKIFSPGTAIRSALDSILRAEIGALIVVDAENLSKIAERGFRVNSKFSSQKIVELSKMDGAIILSKDLKQILSANTLIFPDVRILTKETGARHTVAERTAKQMNTIVIAISKRKKKITIYFEDLKYELEQSSEVLRRAAETLQILEKQKELFNDLLLNLNLLEINDSVKISDVCGVLQKIEIIDRLAEIIKRYLIEMGKEGIMISMRLKELMKNLNKEREMILRDYFKIKYARTDTQLKNMNFDFLLESSNLSRMLFEELHDKFIQSQGTRILGKTNLLEKDIKLLLNSFETLGRIFNADKNSLIEIFKNKSLVESLMQDLESLRDKIFIRKNIT